MKIRVKRGTASKMMRLLEEIRDRLNDHLKPNTCPVCCLRCGDLQAHCKLMDDKNHMVLLVHDS